MRAVLTLHSALLCSALLCSVLAVCSAEKRGWRGERMQAFNYSCWTQKDTLSPRRISSVYNAFVLIVSFCCECSVNPHWIHFLNFQNQALLNFWNKRLWSLLFKIKRFWTSEQSSGASSATARVWQQESCIVTIPSINNFIFPQQLPVTLELNEDFLLNLYVFSPSNQGMARHGSCCALP